MTYGGYNQSNLRKNALLNKLWDRLIQLDRAMKAEAANCRTGIPSQAYKNLKADLEKAKAEYEKASGKGSYDPANPGHGERVMRSSTVDKFLGRKGSDSHYGLEDRP